MDKSISIQSVLYEPDSQGLETFVQCLLSLNVPTGYRAEVRCGDCSAGLMSEESILRWEATFSARSIGFSYSHFGANLGFGGGQNRLAEKSPSDFVLVMNPDTAFASDLVTKLIAFATGKENFGIVEARQFPLEHPKRWNTHDSTTDWCSCCCALIDGEAYRKVGGFDESFFLYCEDVDLSWRIRALGKSACFCPEAGVYHRKRLLESGVETGGSENIWGLVGLLLLQKKYGKDRLLRDLLALLNSRKEPRFEECLQKFNEASLLLKPATIDERALATFGADGSPSIIRWKY